LIEDKRKNLKKAIDKPYNPRYNLTFAAKTKQNPQQTLKTQGSWGFLICQEVIA
jgi:hypothetical protein